MSPATIILGGIAAGGIGYGVHAARHGDWLALGAAMFLYAIYAAVFAADWFSRRRAAERFQSNVVDLFERRAARKRRA